MKAKQAPAVVAGSGQVTVSALYKWSAFALTFGLMLSDYLTRNVISAVFPLLKREWALSDSQLGSLVSVVALVVGVASLPIAVLADRWGRVKSVTAMAAVWCVATLGCGLSQSPSQLLIARGFIGLGEAGFGSAGGAILAHVFPSQQRSAVLGAFLAAALFGSVLGVALGGFIAAHFGWRYAFIAVGAASLALVIAYPLVVRDYRTVALVKEPSSGEADQRLRMMEIAKDLLATPTAIFTYLGSGLQMLILGVISAWIPTYFGRYYGLATDRAALRGAVVVLVAGIGMTIGGWLVDRLGSRDGRNKLRVPAAYALLTFVLLTTAFMLAPGNAQLAFIVAGVFLAGGHAGAAGAVIIDVVHPGLRVTAIALIVLCNNLLGLAPGPLLAGALSDAYGLKTALALAPLSCLAAAVCFNQAARHYGRDCGKFAADEIDLLPSLAGH
jgi:MFS family permease